MADDDLDAFFDEVSAAEAKAVEETDQAEAKNDDEITPPPAKRAKKAVRPVGGIVVAAASSATISKAGAQPADNSDATTAKAGSGGFSSPLSTATVTTIRGAAAPLSSSSVGRSTIGIPSAAPPLPPGPPPPPPASTTSNEKKTKAHVRTAAGKTWVDPSLNEWPENDYRIFVGNLSLVVTDQQLYNHFCEYSSIAKAKVVRDASSGNSKGYGFVSLLEPLECAKAIREKDQTWLSSRPIRTKRSDWKEKERNVVKKKQRKRGYLKY